MNRMSLVVVGLASVAFASSNAHAGEVEISFGDVAQLVASAETCEARGFDADYEGISGLVTQVQEHALANGMSEDEAGTRMKAAILRAFDRNNAEFERASVMSHSLDHVERFNYRWERRCEDLANNSISAAHFSRPNS